MKITKYIVATYKYGDGDTPVKNFDTYEDALEYYESQQNEKWNSVEMIKIEKYPLHYFACVEECSCLKRK